MFTSQGILVSKYKCDLVNPKPLFEGWFFSTASTTADGEDDMYNVVLKEKIRDYIIENHIEYVATNPIILNYGKGIYEPYDSIPF